VLSKILENLNKYNKLKFIFKYVKIFLLFLPLFLSALTHPSHTNEISLEEEIKKEIVHFIQILTSTLQIFKMRMIMKVRVTLILLHHQDQV